MEVERDSQRLSRSQGSNEVEKWEQRSLRNRTVFRAVRRYEIRILAQAPSAGMLRFRRVECAFDRFEQVDFGASRQACLPERGS